MGVGERGGGEGKGMGGVWVGCMRDREISAYIAKQAGSSQHAHACDGSPPIHGIGGAPEL